MSHKGHPDCIHDTKKACEQARREAMGHCVELTGAGDECTNWAIEQVAGRGYCGQHLSSVLLKEDRDRRIARKRAELDGRITAYLHWRVEHPSIWDRMEGA